MKFNRAGISEEVLIDLYNGLLEPRLIEEKMLILLRQGRISKWFSGIGQEAVSVGATKALQPDDYIMTLHRNLGVFTSRNVGYQQLFAQFQGKMGGFTKGRDRSFHFGSKKHHIIGMISHLGAQLGVADGIALANRLSKNKGVVLAYCGDGGASQGDFHESLNVAAVWNLPVIFLIENNGYGLSTPSKEQFRFQNFTDKGPGYGMEAFRIEGNNILEVYTKVKTIASQIRKNPRPVLLEALTFRMRGHEEASGTKYVPKELMQQWGKKDPIATFENFLLKEKVITPELKSEVESRIKNRINRELNLAYQEPPVDFDEQRELNDVYAPYKPKTINPTTKSSQKRFVDAISDGLRQGLIRHPNLLVMGQDIAEYGGVFKVTEGFVKEFGRERIMNTPLCESAILGAGLGLSIQGYKSVIEMQFADFVTCGFNQIVNNLAKVHYRWGQNADVVIRMPTGAGVGAGPFHSQSNEAWFFHTPGLKIVYPSSPYDAKGLLAAAIEEPNPVMFFEHKALYRSLTESVPDDYYTCPIGEAKIIRQGEDITIITYGMGVQWSLKYLSENPQVKADLIDLRSLVPFDKNAIAESVQKTGKAVVVHEDILTGGIGAEIASWLSEECFEFLDGPVIRIGSLDTPVPFSKNLEDNFLPEKRMKEKIQNLLDF